MLLDAVPKAFRKSGEASPARAFDQIDPSLTCKLR
jgi:hypothetical protein